MGIAVGMSKKKDFFHLGMLFYPLTRDSLPVVLLRAIRAKHWIKNLLVFVPLLTSHQFSQISLFEKSFWAFWAFSFCASAIYVLNDVVDIKHDRLHAEKSKRPFASGEISSLWAFAVIPLLLLLSSAASSQLPARFGWSLLGYFAATIAYTFLLKKILFVDVLMLASFYALRIFAGALAIGVPVSSWLFSFAMFFFMSLALVKRYSELRAVIEQQGRALKGRGYLYYDLPELSQLGTTSGLLSILVFALYLSSESVGVLYSQPQILWLICPVLLYWIGRVWLITNRGFMREDPIVFAMRDPESYFAGALIAAFVIAAI